MRIDVIKTRSNALQTDELKTIQQVACKIQRDCIQSQEISEIFRVKSCNDADNGHK
jgi:hypothetical protein